MGFGEAAFGETYRNHTFQHLPELFINDLDLELESNSHNLCPYCDEMLPNVLPEKIQNQLHNLQNKLISEEDRQSFCIMHHAELNLIPLGLSKGYPEYIDFSQLSLRISKFKNDLLDIINGKISSYYRDTALSIYKEIGYNKAKAPMIFMNRCEIFQVSVCTLKIYVVFN